MFGKLKSHRETFSSFDEVLVHIQGKNGSSGTNGFDGGHGGHGKNGEDGSPGEDGKMGEQGPELYISIQPIYSPFIWIKSLPILR